MNNGQGFALQEVWQTSASDPSDDSYTIGLWRACRGDTYTVDELVEPILASTTSTTGTLSGVDIEWRIHPENASCQHASSTRIGTKSVGLVVNTPASVVSTSSWTVPVGLETGNYRVCAKTNELAETSEVDQTVNSERTLLIYDQLTIFDPPVTEASMWISFWSLALLGACTDEPAPAGGGALGSGNVPPTAPAVPFELFWAGGSSTLLADGQGHRHRTQGPDCAPSFLLQFFSGPDSTLKVRFPDYASGSQSLVPPLTERVDNDWSPPQWRQGSEVLGLFGGTATLVSYAADEVAVDFTGVTVCALDAFGPVDPFAHVDYTSLAHDCVEAQTVQVVAVADPPGSFDHILGEETGRADGDGNGVWRDLSGSPLCQ